MVCFADRVSALEVMLLIKHSEGPLNTSTFEVKTQPILSVLRFQGFPLLASTGEALEKNQLIIK